MFNAQKVKGELIQWIQDYFKNNASPETKAVIGISGGKDSSIVAALCVAALGKDRVFGVLMPQGVQYDIQYSMDLVTHLGIKNVVINIGDAVNQLTTDVASAYGSDLSIQARTNLPSRMRTTTIMAVAQTLGDSRMINTSNLSEDFVGFCTAFGGDIAGSLSPLGMLTSDEVKAVGVVLGLPAHLVTKKSEDGLSGKSDEDNFGFTYDVLNKYIRTGVCEDTAVRERIDTMHRLSRFKFLPMPMYPCTESIYGDIAEIYVQHTRV